MVEAPKLKSTPCPKSDHAPTQSVPIRTNSGVGMKANTMSNNTTVAPSVSSTPSVRDWSKDLADRRKLTRFAGETVLLLALAPSGATDEQTVKAVDSIRNELATAARVADGKQDFAKAGKLGKDGKRDLTLDKAKITVTETLGSRLVAYRIQAETWAKANGCKVEDLPLPTKSEVRTLVEGLFTNYGWKRP